MGTEQKGEKPHTLEKPSRKIIARRQDKTEVCVSSLRPNIPTQSLVLAATNILLPCLLVFKSVLFIDLQVTLVGRDFTVLIQYNLQYISSDTQ